MVDAVLLNLAPSWHGLRLAKMDLKARLVWDWMHRSLYPVWRKEPHNPFEAREGKYLDYTLAKHFDRRYPRNPFNVPIANLGISATPRRKP